MHTKKQEAIGEIESGRENRSEEGRGRERKKSKRKRERKRKRAPIVMVGQHEALAVTTGLADTDYSVPPTVIQTVNPCKSIQQPCILSTGYMLLG